MKKFKAVPAWKEEKIDLRVCLSTIIKLRSIWAKVVLEKSNYARMSKLEYCML
jgi:hypothetical protein